MTGARELPHRIIVAGDGQLGVLAAIALRKALPRTEVIVVGAPAGPAAMADLASTALPFTNRLHDRLGIEEERLVREAGASHRLVVRYRGWGGSGHEGVAPYGGALDPKLKTRFAQDWGGGPRNASTEAPPGSLGEVLAANGRFQPPSGEAGSPLAEIDYALRWNAPAYRDLLVAEAIRIGVQYSPGPITGLELDGFGGIKAIGVAGVGAVLADLFIDCTGPGAMLLSRLPEASWRGLQAELPIRALQYGRLAEPALSLADSVTLVPVGWNSVLTGRDGTQRVLAMIEGTTEDQAMAALGCPPGEAVPINPRLARRPWVGNVIALGDSSAHFEPLAWLNLDLAHRQLSLLLDLLPGRVPEPRERDEFNRRAILMAERVVDLLGAHYAAPGAAHLHPLAKSPQLEIELDQYHRRGRLPFFEEAPFHVQEASALLHALGHPSGQGAMALVADPRETEASAAMFAAKAEAALKHVARYDVWMNHVVNS